MHTEEIGVYLSVGRKSSILNESCRKQSCSGKGQLSEADGTFRGKIEYIRELVFLETSFRGLHGEKGSEEWNDRKLGQGKTGEIRG